MVLYFYDRRKAKYRVAKKAYALLAVTFCLVFYVSQWLTLKSIASNKIKYIPSETKMLIINEHNRFSPTRLKEFILSLNIRFPHIVYAQAKLESGNFNSNIFRENHNLFGMKVALRRCTTNKGEQNNHAYYESWRDCVIDYAFYQATYLHDLKTESDYLNYLKINYAEDPNYYTSLIKVIKSIHIKK